MARVFITGSTDGLGRAAAWALMQQGHEVVVHARSSERAAAFAGLAPRALGIVIGDLGSGAQTRGVAEQVNALGRMDAVIHNAGVYEERTRGSTPEGHATTLAVNTLAPYTLSALLERPDRFVFLSSGLHHNGVGPLRDIDWTTRRWNAARAYAETKLHVVALAFALARRWPTVLSNAVDPGWVRTRMGGRSAPVDLETGQRTQSWLAVSSEPAASVSGRYWYQQQQQAPASQALDPTFQDELFGQLTELTSIEWRW